MAKINLKILTSESVKLDEEVDMVIMRCILDVYGSNSAVGDIGLLPNHIPLSAILGINPLRFFNEGNEKIIALYGGTANFRDNVLTIMTERALWPEEIDEERAKEERDLAERAALALTADTDIRSNHIAMRRALVKIEVSSYPLVKR
ncbi:MAG: F0F1 ATP synthase subunit epsilon [Firmicutes bacterium]|nr:F0F1 ATP synthase subunit epsilon [Bacillota bacterium]